jgi:putative glutamine amidotransferase
MDYSGFMQPVIGLSCCVKNVDKLHFHGVGERFIRVVADVLGATPLLIPSIGASALQVLPHLDGLIMTGSLSMVDPAHYGEDIALPEACYDARRDQTTLSLITAALGQGVPLLGICRGIQEMNVALGGTLHQNLKQVPQTLDHLDQGLASDDAARFAKKHDVFLTPDGFLAGLSPVGTQIRVNSLHTQAIKTLGSDLTVEALAPDGVIEAVRVTTAPRFAVGIQWHPEWEPESDAFSMALFRAFLGDVDISRSLRRSTL